MKTLLPLLPLCLFILKGSHSSPQYDPRHPPEGSAKIPEIAFDHKTLFTLGALAVLGGASFYLGRHVGASHGPKHKYPFMSHPYNPYNPYFSYNPYHPHHQEYQYEMPQYNGVGIGGGLYAQPVTVYSGGRSGRRMGEAVAAPTSPMGLELPSPPLHAFARTEGDSDEKHNHALKEPKPGRVVFKDEVSSPSLLSKRSRRAARGELTASSGLIRVEDNPLQTVTRLAASARPEDDYRPLRFNPDSRRRYPSSNVKNDDVDTRGPSYRSESGSDYDDERDYKLGPVYLSDVRQGHRDRPRDRPYSAPPSGESRPRWPVYPPSQRLECGGDKDDPSPRELDGLGRILLEGAMTGAGGGCGLSLVCEIGRRLPPTLPPRAIGLRQLLAGPKPTGLDDALWGELTQSLLRGLAGENCSPSPRLCAVPPGELLRVFAQL